MTPLGLGRAPFKVRSGSGGHHPKAARTRADTIRRPLGLGRTLRPRWGPSLGTVAGGPPYDVSPNDLGRRSLLRERGALFSRDGPAFLAEGGAPLSRGMARSSFDFRSSRSGEAHLRQHSHTAQTALIPPRSRSEERETS